MLLQKQERNQMGRTFFSLIVAWDNDRASAKRESRYEGRRVWRLVVQRNLSPPFAPDWSSLRLALRGLVVPLALGIALRHGVDNGADKEAYHDDHNLLEEPREPVLLLPGATEKERERRRARSVKRRATPFSPPPTPPHAAAAPDPPPLRSSPPLRSWCCRLGGDPAPCAGQIEIRG